MRTLLASFILIVFTAQTHAALPAPPEPLPGTLVLVGGGKLPDSVRDMFFELAGKEKAKIVVIPSASTDADIEKEAEKFLEPWKKLQPLSVEILHTRDRKKADDPAFVKPLTEATAVWISGGDQTRLMTTYKGTLVEKELAKLFVRGKLIGGASAIQSQVMIEGATNRGKTAPGFGWLPGFVVDQQVLQRNRVDRLLGILDKNPGYVGLSIEDGTAAFIRGRHLVVHGDSFAVVCLGAGKNKPASVQMLKAGDAADLYSLRRGALARAGDAFPPAKPADPIVPKGALVIGGGGGLPNDVMKKFIDLAGGEDAPLIVVSSAYEDPVPVDPVECKILRKVGAKNVKILHTRDRKEADNLDFLKDLKEAKGVFREVLAKGGVIGGSSAGASIQSEYMPRAHPLGNLIVMAEGYERGFGYLPGVAVDQHFFARKRPVDMTDLMATYPQLLGIGIDEGTAIVVQGSVMEVMGRTKVGVYDRRKPIIEEKPDYEELPAGAKYDLVKRQRLAK
ncbi:MAG: cyanophycinase [Planctomycetes bacterium]|nr:cyanophycinase [Planctomycetota bacterium]